MGIMTWAIIDKEIQFVDNSFVDVLDEAALAQRLEGRLKMFEGEWFLDENEGVNWIDALSTKPFRLSDFEPIIRSELLSDPAVKDITKLEITPNNATRVLTIDFEVQSDVGLVQGGVAIS